MCRPCLIIATYDNLNTFREAPFAYDIAPLPCNGKPKTLIGTIALAINRESKNKAAKLFADYMLSYENQLYIRQHTLSIPSVKLAAEWTGPDAVANRPYRFHMYREIIPTFRFYTELNLPCAELSRMRDELKFYWSQFDDLDTVLQRIEEKLDAPLHNPLSLGNL